MPSTPEPGDGPTRQLLSNKTRFAGRSEYGGIDLQEPTAVATGALSHKVPISWWHLHSRQVPRGNHRFDEFHQMPYCLRTDADADFNVRVQAVVGEICTGNQCR